LPWWWHSWCKESYFCTEMRWQWGTPLYGFQWFSVVGIAVRCSLKQVSPISIALSAKQFTTVAMRAPSSQFTKSQEDVQSHSIPPSELG
jgi:hypothetical protein